MPKSASNTARADAVLDEVTDFDALLARMGAKDRTNLERHLATVQTESTPDHAKLWKRLAQVLATLAPHAIQTAGQQAVQYFIADGKYRKQVFALEDQRDGNVLIYLPDVLKDAIKTGVVTLPKKGTEPANAYPIKADAAATITLDILDAINTPNPSPWYKHMLGWNRKAIRITLPTMATAVQGKAAEKLLMIAAKDWPAPVAK